jgi:TRAP-type transport system large permease protein
MTVFIFLGSLVGAMALGIPIAYALLASGVALMWHLGLFDAQILRCWRCPSSCWRARS